MKWLWTSFVIRSVIVFLWLIAIAGLFFTPSLLRFVQRTSSINLLIWPSMLDVKKIHEFENRSGIKVHVTYYESNEELLRKFEVTKGEGYDLVIAADHCVAELVEKHWLKKLDKQKLNFIRDLNPFLMHHYFDIYNDYSLPYYFAVYGLGIDAHYFGNAIPEAHWQLLFKNHGFRVTMTDDPRRALMLANKYLFNSGEPIQDEHALRAIKKLLRNQRAWVELYSDVRGEELLAAKSCPVVLTISPDLWRMKQEFPHLRFEIPQEGSFMVLDSFVIPNASRKEDLVYQLLNYIYEPEVLKHNVLLYGFCPPITNIEISGSDIVCPTKNLMNKLSFFKNIVSSYVLNDIWIDLMAN